MARFNKRILRKLGKDAKEFKIAQDEKLATVTTERRESVEEVPRDVTSKPSSIKSWVTSCTKYVYVIIIASLMAGIFTPWTTNIELSLVIQGILSLLLGMAGGVLIYKAIKRQNPSRILGFVGLGLMIISLILIYQLAGRPLF